MTEYPVQCYNNNGEPYGRYVNPYGDYPLYIHPWHQFEKLADANTFPFPSGTIGKTYERDEVEGGYQYQRRSGQWVDIRVLNIPTEVQVEFYKKAGLNVRCIFRLIPQPVEKEPETLISSRQYIEEVYGTSTFARSIECKDAESLMDMMDDFLDWSMQKQQSTND